MMNLLQVSIWVSIRRYMVTRDAAIMSNLLFYQVNDIRHAVSYYITR